MYVSLYWCRATIVFIFAIRQKYKADVFLFDTFAKNAVEERT